MEKIVKQIFTGFKGFLFLEFCRILNHTEKDSHLGEERIKRLQISCQDPATTAEWRHKIGTYLKEIMRHVHNHSPLVPLN